MTAVAIGPDGTAYVANEGGSVLVRDDTSWASRAAPSGDIESLAVTVDGTVWAGTTSGGRLYSFDGADFTEYGLDNVFPGVEEVTVSSARDDTIVWVSVDAADGASLGVGSFEGARWTIHDEAHGMWSDHAQLAVGSNGVVWATHDEAGHGYSRYDGGRWTRFASSQPVGGGGEVAPDGTLWTLVADPDHASSVVESWLVSFDGTSETIHDAPFTGLPQSGTITISIEGATDLDGHRVLIGAWNGSDLVGGAFWTRVDSDPFSARDTLHPPAWGDQPEPTDADGWGADDYLWDRTATLRPGEYRIVAWAHPGELNPYGSHIPSEPIERSCILDVDVNAGETTLVTISDIPTTPGGEPCPSVPSGTSR